MLTPIIGSGPRLKYFFNLQEGVRPDLRDEDRLGVRREVRDVVRGGLPRLRLRQEVRPGAQGDVPPGAGQGGEAGKVSLKE